MLSLISLLLLALAVSLDGFGVGVMYGIRKIRIPAVSILIIAICSGLVIWCSMQIGAVLLHFLSPAVAKMIGAFILIGIGIWAIWQMIAHKNSNASESPPAQPDPKRDSPKTVIHVEIRQLGIVIDILRTPVKADMDRSGTISATEAGLLGLALSLDALGAGLGAALLGFSPLWTSLLIGITCGAFIATGLQIGFRLSGLAWVRKLAAAPGVILILTGVAKLFDL
ncbi:sporulation membrane protein YtaF [Xylanibacillus composti]|uniref:Putative membrane protein YtaF n=1 Tax=Xylanibacillus composti TaxID=1572762 RepID=A0A8J4H791_9BACL|nr:sporulation membrane protein YtaF [Xylanibacillus composti]MDT9724819.1 sporulation membrane protein YtaF [Xylanibacillus composti]GIQ69828.1 putative membrane protein YtaF [Xylanibacillus composti]